MSSADKEAQEDELLAIASIFDESVFMATNDGPDPGGQFSACLELPRPFQIKLNDTSGKPSADLHQVHYLPPIVLNFQLLPDYPSKNPPKFTLSCKWLTLKQMSSLCQKLDEIWEENEGQEILFLWISFLRDETLNFLEIQSPLDLTHVLHRRKNSIKYNTVRNSVPNNKTDSSNKGGNTRGSDVDNYDKENITISNDLENDLQMTFDPRAIQDIACQDLLLPAILEYDQQEKEQTFSKTFFSCSVCFVEKLGADCMRFHGCGHVYCKECMKDYFIVQIMDGSVKALTCPSEKCESQAHPAQVKELVPADLFSKYDRLLLQSSLDTMSDITYCPRKHCECPVMIDHEAAMGSCPACHYVFCPTCKLTYHGVSPCRIRPAELKKIREAYVSANEEEKKLLEQRYGKRTIQRAIEEVISQEWIDANSKSCPTCGTHIQKIDGCNKMVCVKCRSYFCWLCMQLVSKTNPYSHFNSPGSLCFNRLFEGVDMTQEDEFEFFEDEDFVDDFL